MPTIRTSKRNSASSPSPEPSFTADDLVGALADAMREASQVEGVTAIDIKSATGWGRDKVMTAIRRGIDAGVVAFKGRQYRPAIDGTPRPVPVYGLVTAK